MNFRSYLRGAGIGLIVAALVLSFSGGNKSHAMTDDEIKSRARELGMTDSKEVLADVFETTEAPSIEIPVTEVPSVEVPTAETASTETESTEAASAETASTETASLETASTETASTETAAAETASTEAVSSEAVSGGTTAAGNSGSASGLTKDGSASAAGKKEAPEKTEVPEKTDAPEKTDTAGKTVDEIIEETLKDAPKDNIQSDLTGEEKSKSELLADAVETEAESAPAVTDSGSGFVSITVSGGSSSTAVAKALENAGAVSSAAAFDSYLCSKGYDRHLATGEFRIPAGSSDEDIALILMRRK